MEDVGMPHRSARVRYWERLVLGADRAQARSDLEGAQRFLDAALSNAEQIKDPFYFGYTLGRVGRLYEERGQDGPAERAYGRAVAVEAVAYTPKDVHRVPNLGRLALLYRRQGRVTDAQEIVGEIDRVRDAVLSESSSVNALDRVREAYSLGILATFYQEAGDLDQAEELYWLELSELEATLKPESPYLARPLERLASVMRSTGRVGEATELEGRARRILDLRDGARPGRTEAPTAAEMAPSARTEG